MTGNCQPIYRLCQRNYTVLSGLPPPLGAPSRLFQSCAQPTAFGGHIMTLPRRTFLKFAAAYVAAPAFSHVATAESYPSRPITMVVPFPAGGSADATARVLAEQMRSSLGQPIIIENVSGAEGSIGTGRVARA